MFCPSGVPRGLRSPGKGGTFVAGRLRVRASSPGKSGSRFPRCDLELARAVADAPQASTRSESAILPKGWMPVRVAPAPTRSAMIPPYPCSHHAPPR